MRENGIKKVVHGSNGRTRRRNNIVLPGVKRVARDETKSIIDCWKLFFPGMVVDEILKCTNIYIFDILFVRISNGKEIA